MTNKKALYIVIAVLAVVLGLFGLKSYTTQKPKLMSERQQLIMDQKPVDTENNQEMTIKGTFESLLARNAVMKCTYAIDIDNNKTSGTTYVSGKKIRGDYTVNIGDKMMQGHMISDGTTLYTWTDEMPQGMKMMMDTFKDTTIDNMEEPKETETAVNLEQEYDYSCSPWIEDSSIFTVPANIEFVDFAEQTKSMMQNTNSMCAACDYIEDASAKSECKTQFSCE